LSTLLLSRSSAVYGLTVLGAAPLATAAPVCFGTTCTPAASCRWIPAAMSPCGAAGAADAGAGAITTSEPATRPATAMLESLFLTWPPH